MARFHFLNVKNGDCSIIEHNSGHISIIDICNARLPKNDKTLTTEEIYNLTSSASQLAKVTEARKNYRQKAYPENPITYLSKFSIDQNLSFSDYTSRYGSYGWSCGSIRICKAMELL